jgi:lipoprotein-releasing system permease protein
MGFAWIAALRFLREGRNQSLLIIGGVAVGVGVMVFLSALIGGLQTSLIQQTLGSQAHIVIRAPDDAARPQLDRGAAAVLAAVEQPAQRLRTIASWPQIVDAVRAQPGVIAVSPTIAGAGFASRGSADRSIVLRGIDPETFGRIIPVDRKLTAGQLKLGGGEAVIGRDLAAALGVGAGDKIRLSNAQGASEPFTVTGVFDLQNKELNQRWVLVSLRSAQTLLNLSGDVSAIEVTVAEIFEAESIAQRLAAATGLVAESWMKLNGQLLIALQSQSSSSNMIQFFVIVAVALGIASVLYVSVVQKSREIGILRAMGAQTRDVLKIFIIQGLLVGLVGSLFGVLIGTGLAELFAGLARNADGSPRFPVEVGLALVLRSTLIAAVTGVLAAWAPARRAARLDPAEVIRYG